MAFGIRDGWINGAIKVPVQSKGRRKLTNHNRVNLHIAVSNASSLKTSFDEIDEVDSHVYVRHGTRAQIRDPKGMADFEQYVPTTHCAFADLNGNDGGFSIETAGGVGSDAYVGEWDAAQVRRIIWLWNGLRREYDIPNRLATSSKLDSIESKGLSWHRLGVDGNFPQGELGGRLQRGASSVSDPRYMHYSKHWGKLCPTDQRIRQIKSIFSKANLVDFGGDDTPIVHYPTPVEKKREPERLNLLKHGSRGEEVVLWQRFLKGAGFWQIEVDGIFGKHSGDATESYQRHNGLVADRKVGAYTWCEALLEHGRVNKGDHNVAVGIWQHIIKVDKIDYDFGPRTENATEEVQRFLKVSDDGVVWERTQTALLNWWL